MKEIQSIVRNLTRPGADTSVLATLVTVTGSSYRRPGARLLVGADGSRIGSISGGCLEGDVVARAERVMSTGRAEAVTYDTTNENDLVWGVGLGCQGVVEVLIEKLPSGSAWVRTVADNLAARLPTRLAVAFRPHDGAGLGTRLATMSEATSDGVFLELVPPPPMLTLFGAGDNAQPLVRLAVDLGWAVTVADPREALVTQDRFPGCRALVVGPAEGLVDRAALEPNTLAVVMTHRYDFDVALVRDLLKHPLAYLGVQGPKRRTHRILEELGRPVDEAATAAQLHAPVGLDIGAETPEQIAVAVVAEMQAVLSGRNGRPLRERARPIHD